MLVIWNTVCFIWVVALNRLINTILVFVSGWLTCNWITYNYGNRSFAVCTMMSIDYEMKLYRKIVNSSRLRVHFNQDIMKCWQVYISVKRLCWESIFSQNNTWHAILRPSNFKLVQKVRLLSLLSWQTRVITTPLLRYLAYMYLLKVEITKKLKNRIRLFDLFYSNKLINISH